MLLATVFLWALLAPFAQAVEADVVIRGATLYDGSGKPGTPGDLAIKGERIVAVGAFCWYFSDIFSAVNTFIAEAAPEDIEPLRPDHLEYHQLYNFTMAMLILAMSYAAFKVVKMRRQANLPLRSGAMFGIAAVIVISFVLLVFPYRLIWHNAFETVSYQSQRCYILGKAEASVLLYCPDNAIPKVKAVPLKVLAHTGL